MQGCRVLSYIWIYEYSGWYVCGSGVRGGITKRGEEVSCGRSSYQQISCKEDTLRRHFLSSSQWDGEGERGGGEPMIWDQMFPTDNKQLWWLLADQEWAFSVARPEVDIHVPWPCSPDPLHISVSALPSFVPPFQPFFRTWKAMSGDQMLFAKLDNKVCSQYVMALRLVNNDVLFLRQEGELLFRNRFLSSYISNKT